MKTVIKILKYSTGYGYANQNNQEKYRYDVMYIFFTVFTISSFVATSLYKYYFRHNMSDVEIYSIYSFSALFMIPITMQTLIRIHHGCSSIHSSTSATAQQINEFTVEPIDVTEINQLVYNHSVDIDDYPIQYLKPSNCIGEASYSGYGDNNINKKFLIREHNLTK